MTNEQIREEIRQLVEQRDTLASRIVDLAGQYVCDVCGGKDGVSIRPIMCKEPICRICFYIWHDHGSTDTDYIRQESLKRQRSAVSEE